MKFLCSASVDEHGDCYLTVFYSTRSEPFIFNITEPKKNTSEPKPGDIVTYEQIKNNIQPFQIAFSHIQSVEVSQSQEKLLVFGSNVRHPESGMKILVADIKNYLKHSCTYELGNAIP